MCGAGLGFFDGKLCFYPIHFPMKKITFIFLFLSFQVGAIDIGKRVSFVSDILDKSQGLLIYTPPSYDYNKSQSFPVLYVVDGDYNFHYLTGLIELWSNISTSIPEMVVVGISGGDTAAYRKMMKPPLRPELSQDEAAYDDSGRADVMLQVLKKEVMPFINKHYRTNDFDVLGGHSIGGLFVTYAAVHEPALFDRFIAVSPSLWWQDQIMKPHVENELENSPDKARQLYMTLANEQGMGVHGFVEMVQAKRRDDFKFQFKHFPDETHGSVGLSSYQWALFDIFKPVRLEERYFEDATAVSKHAERLTEAFGQSMPVPSGYLRNSCYAHCGDENARASLDTALSKYFPGDAVFFKMLVVEHLLSQNNLEQAAEWLKQAEQLAPEYVSVHHAWYRLHQQKKDKVQAEKAKAQLKALLSKQSIRQWQRNEMVLD